jgi:hypothetical protein
VDELQERRKEELFCSVGGERAERGEERGVGAVVRLEGLAQKGQRVVIVGVVDALLLIRKEG